MICQKANQNSKKKDSVEQVSLSNRGQQAPVCDLLLVCHHFPETQACTGPGYMEAELRQDWKSCPSDSGLLVAFVKAL